MRTFAMVASVGLAIGQVPPASAQTVVPKQVELGMFGVCLLKEAPAMSAKLLRTPLDSKAEHDAARTLAVGHNACIRGVVLTGRSGAIRGAVAEAAFAKDGTLLDALNARPPGTPARALLASGRQFAINYATCLVAADPQHTAAFLRTPYASDAERTGFAAYGEALKACMPLRVEYRVDIPDLRNQIAAIAWQAVAPPEAG